jgi:hypothetical protein
MVDARTLHRRAVRVLPEVLGTSGVLLADSRQTQLAGLLFPLRRSSSGAVMFRISVETAKAIAAAPLDYLKGATRAREGLGRSSDPFVYRGWRMARLPGGWLPVFPEIGEQASEAWTEVCFTTRTDDKGLVVVLASRRLAVYVWRD